MAVSAHPRSGALTPSHYIATRRQLLEWVREQKWQALHDDRIQDASNYRQLELLTTAALDTLK